MNTARLKSIWRLSWPQCMMLLGQFVIGITDVWAGGRISPDVQASIGLMTQCQMLLMALAMAATSGAVASISQSLGANKPLRARRYVGLVLLGGVGLGLLLAIMGFVFRQPFLKLVQTPAHILPVAIIFLGAYLWSLPGQYALTIGGAVFRASQSVIRPLCVTSGVCALNVVGDLGFGLGWWGFPNYGAAGIAWATFTSVTLGAVVLLGLLVYDKLFTADSFPPWRWIRAGGPYLVKVAGPALGTSALWQCGYLVLFVIAAALPQGSVNALAGLTAGLRIEALLFLPAVAFNMTASILVGHSLGAGNRAEAMRVVLTILGLGCSVMSLVALLLWPFRADLAALLTPDPAVRIETTNYLVFNLLSAPFTVASVILAGSLNGAGATIYPMKVFSGSIWLVRLPLAWFLGHMLWGTATGIYTAMLFSQIVQSSLLLYVVLRCDWMRFAMASPDLHPART